MPSVLVFGASGQLGLALVLALKSAGYTVYGVDRRVSANADATVILTSSSAEEQANQLVKELGSLLKDTKLDAIINVAGGWTGGKISDTSVFKAVEEMHASSVESAVVSAYIATKFLKENGLIVLTGSASALKPTPGMIGYGLAKAGVHFLVQSIASADSGLPTGTSVLGFVPIVLDTPSNRAGNPGGNYDDWTPLEDVASLFKQWLTEPQSRPISGSLVRVETKAKQTSVQVV
mmetsp:Transcript_24899/g.41002  ORF Transcript_24899/g.41002 Transcript_24899/m.41002 type:complete len:234 (-) Transcript_24899:95-796(-)